MSHTRSRPRTSGASPESGIDRPVLVIEDQRALSLLLKSLLEERWSCEVHVANSLAQARERLAAGVPYLVALCDLNLPDAAHGEVVDTVRQAGLPAIVLTGAFGDELRDTLLKKGVVDYVLKDGINALNYVCELVGRLARNRSIKLLAVDDSLATRALLKQSLEMYGLQVLLAKDGIEGLSVLREHPDIRVMLVDHYMPEMDGFELIVEARKLFGKDRLAIIGMSASDDPMFSARFLKNGANDFIHKPFHYEEVVCRVNQNLDMLELIDIAQKAANRDFLTGLANRRHFFHEGERRRAAAQVTGKPLAAAMIDIDHFKKVNDTWGHESGDRVLKAVAQKLAETFSDQLAARLGGEEFAVLFTGVDAGEARDRLEACREALAGLAIDCGDTVLSVTASMGLEPGPGSNLDELLGRADEKLYRAKQEGRNRLVV